MADEKASGIPAGSSLLQRVSNEMQVLVEGVRSSVVCVGTGKAEPRTGLVIADGEVITVARAAEPGEVVPIHAKSGQIDATVVGFDSASGLALLRHSDIAGDDLGSQRAVSLGELTVAVACPIPDGHESRIGMVRCVGGETRLPGGRRVDLAWTRRARQTEQG